MNIFKSKMFHKRNRVSSVPSPAILNSIRDDDQESSTPTRTIPAPTAQTESIENLFQLDRNVELNDSSTEVLSNVNPASVSNVSIVSNTTATTATATESGSGSSGSGTTHDTSSSSASGSTEQSGSGSGLELDSASSLTENEDEDKSKTRSFKNFSLLKKTSNKYLRLVKSSDFNNNNTIFVAGNNNNNIPSSSSSSPKTSKSLFLQRLKPSKVR